MNDKQSEIALRYIGVGMTLGIAMGSGLGLALGRGPHGVAVGTSCGIAIGMLFGAALAEIHIKAAKRPKSRDDNHDA